MSKIIDKLEEFLNLYNDINSLQNTKQNEVSEIDKKLSSLYHKIEGINITHVSQSHKLIKELKTILNKRRDLKLELRLVTVFNSNLNEKFNTVKIKHKEIIDDHKRVEKEIIDRAKEDII